MVESALALVNLLSPDQKQSTNFPSGRRRDSYVVESRVLCVNPGKPRVHVWSRLKLTLTGGLRLDECTIEIQKAVHAILRASLSPVGYTKVQGCCLINGFLGEILNGKQVLDELSYSFRLFGSLGPMDPWGYTFFGHHLCLAVVIAGTRMVIRAYFPGR